MFSKHEMQRAIEDALKSMEGVALELYRRGREEAREELEEARRLVDQLGTARDKAEAELRDLQRSTSEALAQAVEWKRERDEARAKCDSLSKQVDTLNRNCTTHYEHGLQLRRWLDETIDQRDEARADAERYLADLRRCASEPYEHAKERAEAFRRGAEAMREACIGYCHKIGFHGLTVDIRALPVPEEP